jgi:D-alanyl-D-alanine carboxypeptidase (penicillin-binding protein 5/6)
MRQKIFFLTILLLFLITNTSLAAEPNILSPSALLMDSKTGQILYEKNIDEKLYPASTTKVMTALLLLEDGDLEKVVEINEDVPNLIELGSSQIYLIPGEKLTREQLLYSLLVDSANDAAVAIAQDISGSVEKFAQKMNEKAKELGAINTNFVNPHGLHDDNHYTTAKDLSIIAKEAMKNPTFRKVVTTDRYIIPATNKQDTRYLYLTNRLIRNTSYNNYQYEGATGIKTGYTSKAKYALIGGATRNNLDLITVILNGESTQVYKDTHSLLDYGFENFQRDIAIKEGEVVKEIPLDKNNESLSVLAKETFEYSHLKNSTQEVTATIELPDEIQLPIEKGDVLGTLAFSIDNKKIDSIPLIADKSVEAPNSILSFFSNLKMFIWLGIAIILFFIYRTYVYIRKKRRRRKRLFKMK